jgi:hypothetical protein
LGSAPVAPTVSERERAATGPHDQAVDDEPDEEVDVAA